MERRIDSPHSELLYIRPTLSRRTKSQAHTANIVFRRKKQHRPHPSLRRGAAFCLSAFLLTATPGQSELWPDLVLAQEVSGFSAAHTAAELPTILLTEKLNDEIVLPPPVAVTEDKAAAEVLPLIRLDTGLDFPSNSRYSDGMIQRLFSTTTESNIRTLTIAPTDAYGYDACGSILVQNGSGKTPDLAALLAAPLTFTSAEGKPKVLIYHTHACEAYTPDELESYTTEENDRSTDTRCNTVRVGAEMAEVLRACGIGVIHDTTMHDRDSYTGAYARSKAAVEQLLAEHPSIEIVIDVHRDALNQPGAQKYKLIAESDGSACAQLMMVIGTDAAANDHPLWERNLQLALYLQQALIDRVPTIARPIKLTRSSYNQFTSPGAMIVEVGANGNTLTEAIRAGQIFARTLAALLQE